jgi:hypothetical protein
MLRITTSGVVRSSRISWGCVACAKPFLKQKPHCGLLFPVHRAEIRSEYSCAEYGEGALYSVCRIETLARAASGEIVRTKDDWPMLMHIVFWATALTGLDHVDGRIVGPSTDSSGMSYCATCCPCDKPKKGYVASKRSPVYQNPCGAGFSHSTAYNYGVYPVQTYAYKTVDREGPYAAPPGQWGRKPLQ